MFKILGLMSLFFASGMIGIYKGMGLRDRIVLLEDYKKMILALRSRINYYREPLPLAFQRLSKTADSRAFKVLNSCIDELNKKDGEISQIWAEKVKESYEKTTLKQEDIKTLQFAGQFLGQTDFENQLQQFQYLDEKLDEILLDAKSDYKSRGTLYSKTGFFIGTILVILLL